ncbi:hypothetical protein GQ41_3987 [Arenibacter algicola]|jgi:hypothetical protein|uniref:Uncharacterized protein n=1 Tax=Arenibacter algicola TaxID=616991 RepID=A0A221USY1_9FLAO|nr:hypothetical protein AREALGSMS7_00884 [Arenibacter algicola]GBF21439.1 hypothetical protein C21_03624 [Arenibacter sp. NBRC 103722]|tara:strand:- start:1335 stop:1538 length:204 start_codon:yes stop_codon:yes gene_type:complete
MLSFLPDILAGILIDSIGRLSFIILSFIILEHSLHIYDESGNLGRFIHILTLIFVMHVDNQKPENSK